LRTANKNWGRSERPQRILKGHCYGKEIDNLLLPANIHGCFSPIDYATCLPTDSGLANCMAQFRKDGNTLVIDGGDTLQGSPLTYYLSHEARDVTTLPAALLNLGGYDFVTLGNHEFDVGNRPSSAILPL